MESDSPVTQPCNDSSSESRSFIDQVNMRFQIMEINMNLLTTQMNGTLSRISNQIEQLYQRVGKLEERVEELSVERSVTSPTTHDAGQTSGSKLNEKITPLLEIIKSQAQEKAVQTVQNNPSINQPSSSASRTSPKTSPRTNPNPSTFKLIENYKYFKKLIYNLNHFTLKTQHVRYVSHYAFNKAIIHPGTPPNLVKALYQHGLIQSIYPSPTLEEISELPEQLRRAVKTYFGIVTQHIVFIRCYSAIVEITPDKFYHPINLIRLGTTKKPFDHQVECKEDIEDDEEFMQTVSRIRAQDHHIIFQEMNRILATDDEAAWVYFLGPTTLIYSSGRTSKNLNYFNQFYDKMKTNRFENTEKTKRRICQLLSEYAVHKCKYCDEKSPESKDFEDPVIDMSII